MSRKKRILHKTTDLPMITLINGSTLEVGIDSFGNARCFWKREDILSVEIPSGVKTIRKESFFECANLERVVIPYGVTTIEPGVFGGCKKLRHITLPESVKVVGARAFAKSGLEEMTLTPRIKQMAKDAFADCGSLKVFVVPEGYKAESFGVYRDKVAEMVVPAELEHLCEDAPRDEWYYGLENKNLEELLSRIEEDEVLVDPVMITDSLVLDDLDSYLVSPRMGGPYFRVKQAYDGLCSILNESTESIEPGDIDLLAANLIVGYLKNGLPDADNPFELTSGLWTHAVNIHPILGLKLGKPCYAVIAEMWHSASFQPFYVLFGFARTKTDARQTYPMSLSYEGYPYSQEKPKIIEISGEGGITTLD